MQDVNLIVTCNRSDCQYCYEGECGKDVLYINDGECLALAEGEDVNENNCR